MSTTLEPRKIVILEEEDNALAMEVYLEVELDDRVFALLAPADLDIEIVETKELDGEETLEAVAPEVVKSLRGDIRDALKAWDVEFHYEDGAAFLRGDPDESFFADCETVEVDTDEGESEDFVVLLELATGDKTYLLLTSMTPELIPAELISEDRARSLEDEELQELEDIFREALSMDEDV